MRDYIFMHDPDYAEFRNGIRVEPKTMSQFLERRDGKMKQVNINGDLIYISDAEYEEMEKG